MNGDTRQHPGRSAEFLSRLHDGELDAAERAHFEAHRAHCAECRRAAVEFEDALAMFRSAGSKPAQPDLAARILRKIQTTSRPRAPFGRRFRMDLGWAALVLTGIFALLLTTPIAIRREEPPIVVSLPTPEPAPASPDLAPAVPPAAPETDRPLRDDRLRRDRPAPAAPPPPASNMSRPAEPPASAPASAAEEVDEKEYDAQAEGAAKSERRPALAAEVGRASGGEESTSAAAAAPAAPLRLRIESIDGFGAAPPLLSSERMALPATYRGHEFILNVDSQGNVSEVGPAPSRERREARAVPATAPTALSELRFEPGNRPRRLLVRFE